MGKTLVICEKPSVATDVARALGAKKAADGFYESDHWVIGHAVGHLVEQVDPEAYDPKYKTWRFEDLPILPAHFRYEARDARAKKQLSLLHKAIKRKDVDRVVNACDAGREGELIFKLILETSHAHKTVERAWFSSMTQKAVKDAFGHLRPDADMKPLESAARARSEADWIVGMNASRAATIKMGSRRAPYSLGRVQTPTLALIVKRDLEIAAFRPEPYWQVRAKFATASEAAYEGTWHKGSNERLPSAEEADRIAGAARGAKAKVASVERRAVTEKPPHLYDLTSLQRDANIRFGFTAKRTLAAAQACYDAHKVLTYPRTDSRYLSSDLVPSLRSVAEQVGRASADYAKAAEYVTRLETLPLGRVVDDARVSDHHAIIPVDDRHDLARLSPDERKIYDLVARRFLAAFHPDAKYDETVVETEAAGELFRSRGKVMVEAGWRAAYGETIEPAKPEPGKAKADGSEEEEKERDQALPPLVQGEAVTCLSAEVLAKTTKPPARYSDATLLRAMETAGKLVEDEEVADAMKERGLGTPATRAATIERLIDKKYVERKGKALQATDRGIGLIGALGDHAIASPAMTGEWELRLNRIEHGRDDPGAFMKGIRRFTTETVKWFAGKTPEETRAHRAVIGPCPRCEGTIVERPTSYSCTSWKSKSSPGCGYRLWKQVGGRSISVDEAREYVARGISADDLHAEQEVLGNCPTAGCGGDIIERGKSFGCTSWKSKTEPGCGFVIWKIARGRPAVTAEMVREMLATGTMPAAIAPSREPIGDCPTPGCGGKIVENSRAFGCTSWKSRRETGCGFVIWKSSRATGQVTREMAVEMLRTGNTGAAAGSGAAAAAARAAREPIGDCPSPGCGGSILPNTRGWGCDSWKSKKKPGCGFVIWRRPRGLGRELTTEEAVELVRMGLTEPPVD